MINPKQITKFDRTDAELQEFLLFCIIVAGKSSNQQAKKLCKFLGPWIDERYTPFRLIMTYDGMNNLQGMNMLEYALREVKMGQYKRIGNAFRAVLTINPRIVSLEKLEKLVGRKTARFFIVHSRANQFMAILDTHILKFMNSVGITAPKKTPTSKKAYHRLEQAYLGYLTSQGVTDVAAFDLAVWTKGVDKQNG
jgi:thermostable 8-oxoguanine DNA glycosylase